MVPVVQRLVYDQSMKKVWGTLQDKTSDVSELVAFLEFVRLHPVVLEWPSDFLNVPGDALQRQLFAQVAASSASALEALSKVSNTNDPFLGWDLLEQAIRRSELFAAEHGMYDKHEAIANFRSRLQEVQESSGVVDFLKMICLAANAAGDAPAMPLPRKRDSLRSSVVFLAMEISIYVREHFRKPLHEIVALTVNAALDLQDEEAISADYVSKLKLGQLSEDYSKIQ